MSLNTLYILFFSSYNSISALLSYRERFPFPNIVHGSLSTIAQHYHPCLHPRPLDSTLAEDEYRGSTFPFLPHFISPSLLIPPTYHYPPLNIHYHHPSPPTPLGSVSISRPTSLDINPHDALCKTALLTPR